MDSKIRSIEEGSNPNFVVYDGTPGTLEARVRMVVDRELISIDTDQF
jgi:hypothetical protein